MIHECFAARLVDDGANERSSNSAARSIDIANWLIVRSNTPHKIFLSDQTWHFYRAMHFSAKRGIAIACRLSVCPLVRPSVTLVNCDHIALGWNSSKIISRLVIFGRSLFATPTRRVCSKGNTAKFLPKVTHPPVDLSVGDIRSQIAA